jgi:hypothetical protein
MRFLKPANRFIMRYFFAIIVVILTFTSCGITRRFNDTSTFATVSSVKDLEGRFVNSRIREGLGGWHMTGSILSAFNIREYTDFVTIVAKSPREIKLIYYNDLSERQEKVFVGEMRGSFFEIYLVRSVVIIPLIYSHRDFQRLRIGKTEGGKLLIRRVSDRGGHLLFLAGGNAHESVVQFPLATAHKGYMPTRGNGLWGFSDSYGTIVIPQKYDFATIFEDGIAFVRLNDKWGLINKQGEEIIPIKYDKLVPFDRLSPPKFRATLSGKVGILDINGNEVIPVIYDYIGHSFSDNRLISIRLNDKWGFANREQVVIPAIYSRIRWGFANREYIIGYRKAEVERDGERFFVDRYGYEYESRRHPTNLGSRLSILETRRRIQIEE